METLSNKTVQIIICLEGGSLRDIQAFRSKESAQKFWDASIEEAKKHAQYEKLPPEGQREFEQDPFGFAYGGDLDLVWEEAVLKD